MQAETHRGCGLQTLPCAAALMCVRVCVCACVCVLVCVLVCVSVCARAKGGMCVCICGHTCVFDTRITCSVRACVFDTFDACGVRTCAHVCLTHLLPEQVAQGQRGVPQEALSILSPPPPNLHEPQPERHRQGVQG